MRLPVTQALDNLTLRMESEDLDLVVTAIKIHARVGGNLTTILDTISNTIRERARLRRDVRVITSMQRISSYVIGMLPIALALLCVLGVLAGIMLRVRAFLFLGVSFLVVDLFTMIWYAAVDRYHTWVWAVSGIVLGAAILALFALFEKRRDDVLRLIEAMKRWD